MSEVLLFATSQYQIALLAQIHLLVPGFWNLHLMDLAKKSKTELK